MKKRWLISICFMVVSLILQAAARFVPGAGQWYAVHVYPLLVGTIGRITGLFPLSVVEIGLYLLLIFCLCYGIRHIRHPIRLFADTAMLVTGLFLVYTLNCGINYYRQPFSSYLGYEIKASSVEELKDLCQYLTVQVNDLVSEREFNGSLNQTNQLGVEAMKRLGEEHVQLSGYYPKPKGVMVSYILSVQQLCGIYSPFTIEANYNRDMPGYNIPHTICHELSHLKGFMREDEANFIGYLACISSDNVEFKYSGYLMGWIYAGNSLAKVDREAYGELYDRLDKRVIEELDANNQFWNTYEGKIAEASTQINDTYLKMNSQEDGVRSYGRVTDLMLAYYRKQGN